MLTPTIQRKLDAMVQSCSIHELPPERLQLANILIRDCLDDLTHWPGLAVDIIEDTRRAIEWLRMYA